MDIAHKIYKKFSKPIVNSMVKAGVTANTVTVVNLFFTLIFGCYFFGTGRYYYALIVMAVSVILDYIDGDIAKTTGSVSKVGLWLDNNGDVIVQNSIMAAVAYGCYTQYPEAPFLVVVMLFFISNATLNMVSFVYNNTFGFQSYNGNALFRSYMDSKPTLLNRFFKNLIDPTASWVGILLYTVRYWILIGVVVGMPIAFTIITAINTVRAVLMFVIYSLHLAEYKKLWVMQALAILDVNREEYYALRRTP